MRASSHCEVCTAPVLGSHPPYRGVRSEQALGACPIAASAGTPAQLSTDVVQSLLAARQMTRCLEKHLLCGMLVSGEAYLVKLTEADRLLMTSLSKVALLAELSIRVFILFELRWVRTPSISWCRTSCSLMINKSVLSFFRDRRSFLCLIAIVSCCHFVTVCESRFVRSGVTFPVKRAKLHKLSVGPNLAHALLRSSRGSPCKEEASK